MIVLPNGYEWTNGGDNSQSAIDYIRFLFLDAQFSRDIACGEVIEDPKNCDSFYSSIVLVNHPLRIKTNQPSSSTKNFIVEEII